MSEMKRGGGGNTCSDKEKSKTSEWVKGEGGKGKKCNKPTEERKNTHWKENKDKKEK